MSLRLITLKVVKNGGVNEGEVLVPPSNILAAYKDASLDYTQITIKMTGEHFGTYAVQETPQEIAAKVFQSTRHD